MKRSILKDLTDWWIGSNYIGYNKINPLLFKSMEKKKLSYQEIIDKTKELGVFLGENYIYKGVEYTVCDITLVAGIDKVQFNVNYYPVDNILVRFSREVKDFKSKFKRVVPEY